MKKINAFITIIFVIVVISSHDVYCQGVAINNSGSSADGSAMLDITSTTSGLLIPRMSLAQRNLISNPATGLMVYQTDNNPGFYYYTGSGWNRVGDGYGTITSISTENGITGGPITSSGTIGLTGQALSLHNLNTNGFIYRNGGIIGTRVVAVSGNGISILNGNGASGNPTISLNIGSGSTQVAAGNHTHDASHVITGEFHRARVRRIISADTRSTNPNPLDYEPALQVDFKANSTDGLTDGGTYHGVLSYRPYGTSTDFTGGPMHQLGFTENGNLWIRTSSGSASWSNWKQIANASSLAGTTNYVAKFTSSSSIGNSIIFDNGTNVGIGNTGPAYKLDVSGDIRSTNKIYANANGASYFRGGDDAELWDINIANTMGVYGVQNSTIASIKLGSGGGTLSGYNGSIGINTTSPTATLHVNGDVVTGRQGVAGTYNSSQVQGIWTIGDGYRIDATNNNFGSQYGIVYAHTNAGTSTTKLPIAGWGHQILFTSNGTRNISLSLSSGHAYFSGNIGLGTTNPAAQLHTTGTVRFANLSGTGNRLVLADTEGDLSTSDAASFVASYTLPNTGGSAKWIKLGTLTMAQHGRSAFIKVVSNTGYNATSSQNYEVYIRFKTSNASSTDANGFAGDGTYYVIGENGQFSNNDRIKVVSNIAGTGATAYDVYMYFGAYTGNASFYEVSTTGGTWTHSGTSGSDPGSASASVLVPKQEFNVRSGSLVVKSDGNVGIGTNSPNSKLHLYTTGSTDGTCYEALRLQCSGSGEPGILPTVDGYGVVGTSSTIFSEDRRFWRFYVYDDYYYGSTTKIKSNIEEIFAGDTNEYLDKLCNIRSIRFDLNKDIQASKGYDERGNIIVIRNGQEIAREQKIGVDVASLPPEAKDEKGENVSVSGLQGLIIVSMKALKHENDMLRDELKKQNDTLKQIQSELNELKEILKK